jgi:hypothetical protein
MRMALPHRIIGGLFTGLAWIIRALPRRCIRWIPFDRAADSRVPSGCQSRDGDSRRPSFAASGVTFPTRQFSAEVTTGMLRQASGKSPNLGAIALADGHARNTGRQQATRSCTRQRAGTLRRWARCREHGIGAAAARQRRQSSATHGLEALLRDRWLRSPELTLTNRRGRDCVECVRGQPPETGLTSAVRMQRTP